MKVLVNQLRILVEQAITTYNRLVWNSAETARKVFMSAAVITISVDSGVQGVHGVYKI